eukprot:1158743-Pelagomonas_calceolata.AAC.43
MEVPYSLRKDAMWRFTQQTGDWFTGYRKKVTGLLAMILFGVRGKKTVWEQLTEQQPSVNEGFSQSFRLLAVKTLPKSVMEKRIPRAETPCIPFTQQENKRGQWGSEGF